MTVVPAVPIGQHPPPREGYSIERFERYVGELAGNVEVLHGRADARAVFELTYLTFSRAILGALQARRFEDMDWAVDISCRFVEVYQQQFGLWERRDPAQCGAWRIAFSAMTGGGGNALQAMLLGMNAHINYDLAFVTLGACLHAGDLGGGDGPGQLVAPTSRSGVPAVRYRDFLLVNQLGWEAIREIQDAVLRRHNPLLYWGNRLTMGATRQLGERALMEARDTAWYRTALLVHARSADERALVGGLIEVFAENVAYAIRTLTLRPDRALSSARAWTRRGERLPSELQSGLLEMACGNRAVSELVLRGLAFAGADPARVVVTLLEGGEARLAAVFAWLVREYAPRRERRRLESFLREASPEAVALTGALVDAGDPRGLPRGAPVGAARQRWERALAGDLACLDVPEVASDATLAGALQASVRRTRARLRATGSDGDGPRRGRRLSLDEAGVALAEHADAWVRLCARRWLQVEGEDEAMASVIERVLFLKETPLFVEVDVSSLVHVADELEPREFEDGEVFVREGTAAGGVYLIASGEVEVSQERGGRRVVVARLGPGDSAGELSALSGGTATADCVAVGRVECWFLPTSVLVRLLNQHPRLGVGLIEVLSERLVATTLLVS